MREITDETFSDSMKNPLFVLSFTSPWCASCKKVHARTLSIEKDYEAVTFGTLDISTSPKTPAQHQVISIPTIILFKDGTEVNRLRGTISEADLRKELDTLI